MMRSLWTAASGMIGEQSNLDVIEYNRIQDSESKF